MTVEQPDRRVTYVTWNLMATGVLGVVAFGDVVPALVDDPWSPALWISSAAVTAALAWAVWKRRRRPTWLLPRLYLLSAVPVGLTFLVANAMTAFWLGAIWLLIFPALLSGDWLDRWLGAPAQPSSTQHR